MSYKLFWCKFALQIAFKYSSLHKFSLLIDYFFFLDFSLLLSHHHSDLDTDLAG